MVVGDRLVTDLGMLGYATEAPSSLFARPEWIGVASGEWWRMVTAAFLHEQVWHIAFNMLGLWYLGPPLEAALGRVRFLALYLISGIAGNALFYLLAPQNQLSLGASGAIFGLFGATAVLMRRMRYDMRPIAILLGINLVITFAWADIAWQAHIGGLVAGALIAYGMVHAPRRHRTLVQTGTCAVVVLAIVVACAVRTSELLG
jgi:membrane associated rhomboid family serine protease